MLFCYTSGHILFIVCPQKDGNVLSEYVVCHLIFPINIVGVARCFTYGGSQNSALHDPNVPPRDNLSKEKYMSKAEKQTSGKRWQAATDGHRPVLSKLRDSQLICCCRCCSVQLLLLASCRA